MKLTIVFDMDNTLVDEMGASVRPGMVSLLEELSSQSHVLKLWTSSTKERAKMILTSNKIKNFFSEFIYREDYDPENLSNRRKDIRRIGGTILIDDDPNEISFVKSLGLTGILVSPYRKGVVPPAADLENIRKAVSKDSASFLKRLFYKFLNWDLAIHRLQRKFHFKVEHLLT